MIDFAYNRRYMTELLPKQRNIAMSETRRYFVYVCASCRTICQPHVNRCPECGGIVVKEEMKI
jgi:rRNA maturation endonuclease Nob1